MSNFEKQYSYLNPEQKEAVDTIYWPVMVVAGPGTGKTQIMALRAANIILKTWIDPRSILITTFTEAGIISLKKRLFDFIWTDSYKINISTIHSFCNDVITAFPEKFLEYRAFNMIDEITQIELLESIIENWSYEALSSQYDKFHYLKSIIDRISKLKQEWIWVSEFAQIIEKQRENYKEELQEINPKLKKYALEEEKQAKHIAKLIELNDIYAKYLQILNERWLYDFSDMIDFVLKKFKQDADLRLYYAMQYQFIMIDEYQDTNNAQNEIIDLILWESEDKNIMVVGDDDQSIYRFQWANLENMLNFSQKYENTKFVVLKENYRSEQSILDIATKSITNNKSRITNYIKWLTKELHANKKYNTNPEFFIANSDIEEKAHILQQIKQKLSEWQAQEDIAIVVRTNSEVESFTEFLQANWLLVDSKLKSNIFKSKYIKLLLDLINIVANPYLDEAKLINVLRSDLSWISRLDILMVLKKLYNINYKWIGKKLFELISDNYFLQSISKIQDWQQSLFDEELANDKIEQKISDSESFLCFVNKILNCQQELGNNFYNVFKKILEEFGFIEYVEKSWQFSDLEDLFTLLNYVKSLVVIDKEFSIEAFLKKISYYEKYNISMTRNVLKSNITWINVMTAHQSKWLEYETVFMPSLFLWNWWSRRVIEKIKLPFWVIGSNITEWIMDENEEERRLFFVALTRAKKDLILSVPNAIDNKIKLQAEFLQELELTPKIVKDTNLTNVVINEFKNINFDSFINKEEELYIKEFLKSYKLSASDLNKFLKDPRLFLRDVIFKYPFEDNEFTIFGKVYHKTLEYFYLEYKNTWEVPDYSFLESKFIWLLGKEILSKDNYEKLLQKWLEWLKWWLESKSEFSLPIELEYNFRSRNIVFEWIPLTGKIDKIDSINENEVVLIDYKTGKTKSINEIKWETQNSEWNYFRQLLFYKIMFDLDSNISSKYSANNLALEFVEWRDWNYSFIDVDFTYEDIDRVKSEIIETWNKINDIEFWRGLV